ncbi:NAD-dependent epimerase/dehydratase family protein [Pendulispora rubella]|uniref:NAD-dependent epimerase/dehydratase family protein n=1 Tax=Pendulispora rubella TaxID=2741070 RepID=A0ABZ2KZ88_9BACT
MARYLVTGATGFLGRHLVTSLLRHGHEVVALCRQDEPSLAQLGVAVRRGDVLDAASVRDAAAGCEGLFHCAGKVSRKPEDAEELRRLHVDGTKITLDACKEAGVRKVVYASTSGTVAISDDPEHVGGEEDETPIGLISRWPYYRSKLFAEQAALERHAPGAFSVVSVNPTLLLGPGDVRGSSVEDVRLFLERKIPAVPAGGLSFVDARDAAEGMRLAMEKGEGGQRYLLSAINLTLRAFFERLERASGVKAPWLPTPRAPLFARRGAEMLGRVSSRLGLDVAVDPVSLDMAQYYWYVDATRAETVLGFQARDPQKTLADTVEDLRERGVVWPASSWVASS